jgi:2-aminomuconate deaminase
MARLHDACAVVGDWSVSVQCIDSQENSSSGGVELMDNSETRSSRAPEPVGAFPHAKRVGNLLFLSGIGPRKRGSKDIPGVVLNPDGSIASYDIETQCRAVFENVRFVLEDAGSMWENIVDVQVFLTNMKDDFAKYNKLYAEHFAGPPGSGKPNPTRTTIEINCLPTPIAIELKVIATID